MALSHRVDTIDRDVAVLISDALAPAAQSAILAKAAREQLAAGENQNRSVLGRVPPHSTTVDGARDASEDRVAPNGIIVYEFDLVGDVFVWIADQLKQHSPVGGPGDPHPGLYQKSFTFFADGKEVEVGGEIPGDADEYAFINFTPYTRKIEQGQSSQAPDGVFHAVALLARARFGNVAKFEFTYRGMVGSSSGSGTLVNPLLDPTRVAQGAGARNKRSGRFVSMGGPKAYNKSDVRYPCIVIRLK